LALLDNFTVSRGAACPQPPVVVLDHFRVFMNGSRRIRPPAAPVSGANRACGMPKRYGAFH